MKFVLIPIMHLLNIAFMHIYIHVLAILKTIQKRTFGHIMDSFIFSKCSILGMVTMDQEPIPEILDAR